MSVVTEEDDCPERAQSSALSLTGKELECLFQVTSGRVLADCPAFAATRLYRLHDVYQSGHFRFFGLDRRGWLNH